MPTKGISDGGKNGNPKIILVLLVVPAPLDFHGSP